MVTVNILIGRTISVETSRLELSPQENRSSKNNVKQFFELLQLYVEHAVVESARELSGLIPSSKEEPEDLASELTNVIMFVGLVALREFGRQRGWIAAQFGVSLKAMNCALGDYDENKIQANVVSNSLLVLNEEVRFAPESQ